MRLLPVGQIRQIAPIRDRGVFIVCLAGYDWDFTIGISVGVSVQGKQVIFQQTGVGDRGGKPVLELRPIQPFEAAFEELGSLIVEK